LIINDANNKYTLHIKTEDKTDFKMVVDVAQYLYIISIYLRSTLYSISMMKLSNSIHTPKNEKSTKVMK